MKKDLSAAIERLSSMRDCDVLGTREMAEIFGMNPNGIAFTIKTTQFTKPDIKSGRYSFWSKKALSAEIERRQEKIREHDATTAFYARLSKPVAEFAKKKGGRWLERVLESEMNKSQKNS